MNLTNLTTAQVFELLKEQLTLHVNELIKRDIRTVNIEIEVQEHTRKLLKEGNHDGIYKGF